MSHATPIRITLAATALIAVAAGCHRPGGAIMSRTGGSQTYASYETMPKTLQLMDLRSGEIVFTMDIPPGKQLTLDFLEGAGSDNVYSPDLMRYQVLDLGTTTGRLKNMMSVPAATSRRIEISLRQAPEYVTAAPDRMLRTDEMGDRPDWWTPEGGELPVERSGMGKYDD